MEDPFLTLSQLFDCIGIIEKGIERIYNFLLINKRIENLKEVCEQFGLTLKRGYKICSVLSDLELVQIYDRPMKINLAMPLVPIWQKIINNRIEELASEFQESKLKCEVSFETFRENYELKEEVAQEPVEFISFNIKNMEDIYHEFSADSECKIAVGIEYESPIIKFIKHVLQEEEIPIELFNSIKTGMSGIKKNLKKINIKVIFNSEMINSLLKSKEFKELSEFIKKEGLELKNIEVHITDENFSNFSLTDNELIQPSFDPTNKLIGAYISRNASIYQIFYDKFVELFDKGMPINDYIKQDKDLSMDPLSDIQKFALCLL